MQVKIKGILSYPHLFTPRAVEAGADPKYSVNVLLHESDPQLATVQQAIEVEKQNGFPNGFPAGGKVCLVQSAQYAGYWEVRTSTSAESKPAVVDKNVQPILDPAAAVPGHLGWVAFNTFPYNKPMSKGVAAGLNGVMILGEEGPLGRLDNKPSAEELFADIAGPGTGMPSPTPPAAPNFMGGAPAPPAPPAPPVAPAPPAAGPSYTMTAKAAGVTREAYHAAGWTDEMLVSNGLLVIQ